MKIKDILIEAGDHCFRFGSPENKRKHSIERILAIINNNLEKKSYQGDFKIIMEIERNPLTNKENVV